MKYCVVICRVFFLFFIFSCKKDPIQSGSTSFDSLPFRDSSYKNSKNLVYQKLLDKYTKTGLPGLVVLINTPKDGMWIGSSGLSNIEYSIPMNKTSLLYSASVGKTYCAVAILKLVEEGKIQLDDRVSKYLSKKLLNDIPNADLFTIRELLQHTSGIPNFDENINYISDVLNVPYSITSERILNYVRNRKELFSPGSKFGYSSTGYELLAALIDEVTGEHHSKYYSRVIFKPLGLNHTFYKNENSYPTPMGVASSYFDRLGDGKIENVSMVNNHLTKILTGSDGIIASIHDYSIFIEQLFNYKILTEHSISEMTKWRETYASQPKTQYGLGFYNIETQYGNQVGHTGSSLGAGIAMYYFPSNRITIISATNVGTFLNTGIAVKYKDFRKELLDVVFN